MADVFPSLGFTAFGVQRVSWQKIAGPVTPLAPNKVLVSVDWWMAVDKRVGLKVGRFSGLIKRLISARKTVYQSDD